MMRRIAIAILAIVAITIGLHQLNRATDSLIIERSRVGVTPVTIFRPDSLVSAPVVVIAHGFAGSQQLMLPFATTLASNGYIAVTFDFLGHGRNPEPMRRNITEAGGVTAALVRELGEVTAFARKIEGSDGRLAVLGHSMASDIVVRFAQANADIQATVAVSVFSRVATATSPRNLLIIVGSLEPSMLKNEGLRLVQLTAGEDGVTGKTYGEFADGTARRLILARGVEHIGVLYSRDSLDESLRWMNSTFDKREYGFIDQRGKWLALLFVGITALAWPLSSLLPVTRLSPIVPALTRKQFLVAALAPAVLTPLILWKAPTELLPILLGDYLALHFLLYAIITAAIAFYFARQLSWHVSASLTFPIVTAAIVISAYNIFAFGLPLNAYVFSFMPIPSRVPLIIAIACGTLPYFIADEMLTRGDGAMRGAYLVTKLCFLLSLAFAIVLNPMKLFFLAIIVPAILLLFVVFGLISRWSYAATGHPLPAAFANGVIFAWAIAVTFPLIVR